VLITLKTDSLFYYLFQTLPGILFELLGQPATLAQNYEFRSVELKQTAFRIDGVFLPQPNIDEQPVYIIEVQFQRDLHFYQRFFAEIFLFLQQNPETVDVRPVVLFAKRSIEPEAIHLYRTLLEGAQVQRVYLEDLTLLPTSSLGIGLVQLIVAQPEQAQTQAQQLLTQTRSQEQPTLSIAAIIELIETIVVYKFPQLSRQEIEQMLGLSEIRQTRVYQEALQEGRQEGRQEEGLSLVLRLLTRRVGVLTPELEAQVRSLSLTQIEGLSEALLDFTDISDLRAWLPAN
jgi:predicted transposase/invertase (TIGR01784 family)